MAELTYRDAVAAGIAQEMERDERRLLADRELEWQDAVLVSSRVTWGGSALLISSVQPAAELNTG